MNAPPEAAPAGGRLPLRGRWQGEALTDEGNHAFPIQQSPVLFDRGPLHTRRCGGTLSRQERAGVITLSWERVDRAQPGTGVGRHKV